MRSWAVVPAAGAGRRMGGQTRKQYLSLGGRPLLVRTLEALTAWEGFSGLVVVAPAQEVARVQGLVDGAGIPSVLRVVSGGAERQDSVRLGLASLCEAAPDDLVFVHDGVRPFPPVERFAELRDQARPDGALLAVPCRDTLKREQGGCAEDTVDRSALWQAQTPQAFPLALLREALERAQLAGIRGTDEADLVQALGRRPRLVRGDASNLKVTAPEDMPLAEAIASARAGSRGPSAAGFRVGHGYDVHRLVGGRQLVLGGVGIPHELGLLGHSDADVLAHAVADACLGAAGLGDIGRHFPDSDPRWKGASSLGLLARVNQLLEGEGLRVVRVDATLIAERPKVAAHVGQMEENLSRALGSEERVVTVKATTTEGLGFEGRQEGMSAHAIAVVAPRR